MRTIPNNEFVVALTDEEVSKLKIAFIIGEDNQNRYEIRHLVGQIGGSVKVEIFSNEDPPPHFRVLYQGSTANFTIKDCSLRDGSGQVLRYQKKIRVWWAENKQLLIDKWNSTRPAGCPVGEYRE